MCTLVPFSQFIASATDFGNGITEGACSPPLAALIVTTSWATIFLDNNENPARVIPYIHICHLGIYILYIADIANRYIRIDSIYLHMKVNEYPKRLDDLPEPWKPIPFSYEHKETCRFCEMRRWKKGL
jgi:hypothetical protein